MTVRECRRSKVNKRWSLMWERDGGIMGMASQRGGHSEHSTGNGSGGGTNGMLQCTNSDHITETRISCYAFV